MAEMRVVTGLVSQSETQTELQTRRKILSGSDKRRPEIISRNRLLAVRPWVNVLAFDGPTVSRAEGQPPNRGM
jgi:hypothetical protein